MVRLRRARGIAATMVAAMTMSCFSFPAAAGELENENAVAGMAVVLNNYYAGSETPEEELLSFLTPLVEEEETEAAAPETEAPVPASGTETFEIKTVMEATVENKGAANVGLISVAGFLNVRETPSATGTVVGRLYSNCQVVVADSVSNDEGDWLYVVCGDVSGYVSSSYVLTGDAAQAAEGNISNRYATVLTEKADVLDTASEGGKVVGEVHEDEQYKVIENQDQYVKLHIGDQEVGYVSKDEVKVRTQFAEAMKITDQDVRDMLDGYLNDVNYARSVYDEAMASGEYYNAYSAMSYISELLGYYQIEAEQLGLTELIAQAKSEQEDAEQLYGEAYQLAVESGYFERVAAQLAAQREEEERQAAIAAAEQAERERIAAEQAAAAAQAPVVAEVAPAEVQVDAGAAYAAALPVETPAVVEQPVAEQPVPAEIAQPVQEAPAEQAFVVDPAPVVVPPSVTGIEACYNGGAKTEGQVISANELFVRVYYSDGSVQEIPDGWYSPNVGMTLAAGTTVVTMYYGDFQSSFELPVNVDWAAVAAREAAEQAERDRIAAEQAAAQAEADRIAAEQAAAAEQAERDRLAAEQAERERIAAEQAAAQAEAERIAAEQAQQQQQAAGNSAREQVVNYALSWVGQCNYVYGGTNLTYGGGVDCSGFTMRVYATVGINLPHYSMSQPYCGAAISHDQLLPGDLVWFDHHVGIYIGNDQMVHAASPTSGILVSNIYYNPAKQPLGYTRLIP